jgi:hypothetical protein
VTAPPANGGTLIREKSNPPRLARAGFVVWPAICRDLARAPESASRAIIDVYANVKVW